MSPQKLQLISLRKAQALAFGPLQVVDLEKAQALGLEMETLKALERARGKGLERETEREWAMELERGMVWVLERVGVCL